jgi:hypothetical protein
VVKTPKTAHLYSPRLVNREQAAHFHMEIDKEKS